MGVNAGLPTLLRDVIAVCGDIRLQVDRRHLHRSVLPFLPPLSLVFAYYNKLSDGIRVLRPKGPNYKIHVPSDIIPQPGNSPNGDDIPVTCATISIDGCHLALGFRDGVVEVIDVERSAMTSRFSGGPPYPLVWLLFIGNGRQLVTENSKEDICILDNVTSRRRLFASPHGGTKNVITSLSHDGSMITRVAERSGTEWFENMSIIHISKEVPTINALAPPPTFLPLEFPGKETRFPLRRAVGFSPDGRYVAAFDAQRAFVWSSTSFQIVAQHSVHNPQT